MQFVKATEFITDQFRRGEHAPVDDSRFYRATLYLGASQTYSHYAGGRWQAGEPRTMDDGAVVRHEREYLARHRLDRIDGEQLNGLIAAHNNFLFQTDGRAVRALLVGDVYEVL